MNTHLSKTCEQPINRDSEAWQKLQEEVAAREAAKFGPPRPDAKPESTWVPDRRKRDFVPEYGNCDTHGRYQLNRMVDGVERFMPDVCQACQRQKQIQRLFAQADIPQRFEHCTFENYEATTEDQKRVLSQCKAYAEGFKEALQKGICLILRGNYGTGKNHLSTAIIRAVLGQGHTALRVKASAFLDNYWAKDFDERDRWISELARIDLLMLDELGRTTAAKSAEDAFFRLVDARYESGKPTMLITNLSREEIVQVLTQPGFDRLRQGGGRILNFTWGSFRAQAGNP